MFDIFKSKQERLQAKVEKFVSLQNEFSGVNTRIDELAIEFATRDSEFKKALEQEKDEFIRGRIESKYQEFTKSHLKNIGTVKREKESLMKAMEKVYSDDPEFQEILAEEKLHKSYTTILSNYRSNKIDLNTCDTLLKAVENKATFPFMQPYLDTIGEALKTKKETGKVKYSDNIVFNNEGKLLLLKRSGNDKTFAGMYVIPGGHVDLGEDCETAAKRELYEEAGIEVEEVQFAGEYEDKKVHIKYYQSHTDKDPILQQEEIWGYEWVDPRELDKYEFPLNMKQNIQKILYPSKEVIVKLGKAFKSGKITREKFVQVLDVLSKAQGHKYIRKELKNGEWEYIYKESEKGSKEIENKKLGNSGKFITKTATNPTQVYKGVQKWLDSNKQKFDVNFSRTTSSIYVETKDDNENTYKIRLSNHSPAISDEMDWKGIKISDWRDGTFDVEIDSSVGFKTEDIKNIQNIVNQTSKEIKDVEIGFNPEEISKLDTASKNELIGRKLDELGLKEDHYDVNRLMIESKLSDYKLSKEYKEFVKNKQAEESKGKLSKDIKINGAEIKVRDNWVSYADLSKFEPLLGSENKKKRKIIADKIQFEWGNQLRKEEITPQEFEEKVNTILNVIGKSLSKNYEELLKKQKERRDPEGIEEDDIEDEEIGKSFSHKYISKKPDGKGGWEYEYEEEKINNNKTEEVKDKNINFKQIKDYAERIIKGEKQIERLSPEEEQGRITGGRINVEATLQLGSSSKTDEEFPNRGSQLENLEKLSKNNGYFVEDYEKEFGVENRFDKATESEVFYDNSGFVIKINNFSQHEDISEMFDRISIQNLLFPDTKYEVLGFTKREGELNVILKQPFIEMKTDSSGEVIRPSKEELSTEMKSLGYEDKGGNMFMNEDYIVEDLHSANVCFSKGGVLMFIDPVIRINLESEGYGGKRKLGDIDINKSTESTLQKALEDNLITPKQYDLLLEKAWTKHPVGAVVTRKDGTRWKKISETGNSKADWKQITKDKGNKPEDAKEAKNSTKEEGQTQNPTNLAEAAKNASETALNAAIKTSGDENIRQAAHEELDRRDKEERVQEEEKGNEKKNLNTGDFDDEFLGNYIKEQDEEKLKKIKDNSKNEKLVELAKKELESRFSNGKVEEKLNTKNEEGVDKEIDNLIKNRPKIKYDTVVYDENSPNKKKKQEGESDIIDLAGRKIVVLDVKGMNIPFYLSTGHGGKADVTSGKWYPIFGVAEDGWMNKLSGKEINDYYGSEELKKISEKLDSSIGDIRDDNSVPKAGISGKHIDFINKDLKPTNNGLSTTRDTINRNISSVKDHLDKSFKNNKSEQNNIKKSEDDQLNGGKADKLTLQQIADKHKVSLEVIKKQVHKGVKVEMEHTDDPKLAIEIAMDHLTESPEYYTKLAEMESSFDKEKEKDE